MFSITGERRRRFARFVNRNLERALGLTNENDNRIMDQEEEEIIINDQEVHQRLQTLRALLAAIPRGLGRILIPRTQLARIREALRGLRIDQIPGELLEQLNHLF